MAECVVGKPSKDKFQPGRAHASSLFVIVFSLIIQSLAAKLHVLIGNRSYLGFGQDAACDSQNLLSQ